MYMGICTCIFITVIFINFPIYFLYLYKHVYLIRDFLSDRRGQNLFKVIIHSVLVMNIYMFQCVIN